MDNLLGIWLMMAVIAAAIAYSKGRSIVGFLIYGFLLPPIAILHALVMRDETKSETPPEKTTNSRPQRKCPFCAEMILAEAKFCRFCGKEMPPISISSVHS